MIWIAVSLTDWRNFFKAYVSHIVEHAYASDLKDNLKNQTAEQQQRCLAAIQHVLQWCEMHLVDTTRHALVIWALFTQETNKLLQGKLNKFTFQPKRKKIHDDAPWKIDGKLSARIGANIILFDHLLDLFSLSESDRRFAKYQFYVFTRYDRFTHYRTSMHQYLKFEACEVRWNGLMLDTTLEDHSIYGGALPDEYLCLAQSHANFAAKRTA